MQIDSSGNANEARWSENPARMYVQLYNLFVLGYNLLLLFLQL